MGENNRTVTGAWTWTVPNGVTLVKVELWGGGGGGGGGNATVGGTGGAGGGFAQVNAFAVVPGQSHVCFVGNGGAGGGTNANGVNGTNTIFRYESSNNTTLALAEAGARGYRPRNAANSLGGNANSIGDVEWGGGNGANYNASAATQPGSGGGGGGSTGAGTQGANTLNAAGGGAGSGNGGGTGGGANKATAGGDGLQAGGGGAGGGNANFIGGTGGVGKIVITWTYSMSMSPSKSPSGSPSISPSLSPSVSPSGSISPSKSPSTSPSKSPSVSPSASPSPTFDECNDDYNVVIENMTGTCDGYSCSSLNGTYHVAKTATPYLWNYVSGLVEVKMYRDGEYWYIEVWYNSVLAGQWRELDTTGYPPIV
jgi:hypothetical protein